MIHKPKILCVDDKPENLIALKTVLAPLDVDFIEAHSGSAALQHTLDHDFALALVDVQMPEMDGFEMVKLMRQVKKTRYLPVIFISAIYSDDFYAIKGIESGAVDFISKPFEPKILKGKVNVFLELYRQKKLTENALSKHQTLLKEIHHRIKNHLQIVTSLLGRQGARVTDTTAKSILHECQNQIQSISMIHDSLCRTQEISAVDFTSYLELLVQRLINFYGLAVQPRVTNELAIVTIPQDVLIPCSLIITELITNALKHAFPENSGKLNTIEITLRKTDDSSIELKICDNGIGIPELQSAEDTNSTGMQLVEILAIDQLDGIVSINRSEGTCVSIQFPESRLG